TIISSIRVKPFCTERIVRFITLLLKAVAMKAGEEFLLASAGELAGSMPIHFLQRLVASLYDFSHSSRAERLFWGMG
ncbi:MAG: hypothetical protein E7K47_22910, partial [Acidovorax sp.]|nr:hypothetical protein [Acidovorax sp.]